ncbi:MAG: YerC/YecD family TrpR-related protein [Wenzhouxiangellaceae bacterium]|nr:YerC/YecD family TrpR-related protein [Wenzhouxiangellaceae bacterium]
MKHLDEQHLKANRAGRNNLAEAFMAMQSADECRSLLKDLTTPAELEALVDRWRVVQLLDAGLPYREIHDRTGVSVTTVGRVARFLEMGNGGYRLALERLQGEQET